MRFALLLPVILFWFSGCRTLQPLDQYTTAGTPALDTLILQSLFQDKSSTISEENIQKILEGNYQLPRQLRVAIVRLESSGAGKRSYWNYWNDEQYVKTQQSYVDLFTDQLKASPRVTKISLIPDLLISKTPTFTSIREAAVRMQADMVMVYAITSDIYSRTKLFTRTDLKAFATTQLILLDVKTGLIPFSAIVTKDYISEKQKEEMDRAEASTRIQNEAVLLTLRDIGQKINQFLNGR